MTVCKMSVEEKLRKLRGKRTLEILINSQRGKFSAELYEKWGIRVECTVCMYVCMYVCLFVCLFVVVFCLFVCLFVVLFCCYVCLFVKLIDRLFVRLFVTFLANRIDAIPSPIHTFLVSA